MKKLIPGCTLCLLLTSLLHAQTPAAAHPDKWLPAFYIDSQLVTHFDKIYLDAQNITNVWVVKGIDSAIQANGKVYITSKTGFASFLSLADVTRTQQGIKKKKILYIIDNKVILDTTGIRIDPSFILSTHTVSADSIRYAGIGRKKIKILMIETRAKKQEPPPPGTIMIRGNAQTTPQASSMAISSVSN